MNIGEGMCIGSIKHMGSLFAVYELLESRMGVKWLWPGKLGEVIPSHDEVRVAEWDQSWEPPLVHARVRTHGSHSYNRGREGWSSDEARARFLTDEYTWLRRHRFARSVGLEYGHAFASYWDKYGEEHPEYFNLLPNGKREPDPHYWYGADHVISMCVSQPAFWKRVVANWEQSRTDVHPWINLCENDVNGKCTCDACLAWDAAAPGDTVSMERATEEFGEGTPQKYGANWHQYLGSLSDRYARFYVAVQKEAEKIDPNATVIGFSYNNYAKPPVEAKLNERVIINLVPGFMFPWSEERRQGFRDQWLGWSATGARLYLRPNYTLDGHNFPIYYARKLGEDFAFAFTRGMIATDFDSLTGQYSNQGPNMYVLARIQTQGDRPVDEILDEYYAGFGRAEAEVRAYFDHWEAVSDAVPADALKEMAESVGEEGWGGWTGFYKTADALFTPDVMRRGFELLDEAAAAAAAVAGGDAGTEERVAFLRNGLKHAELTMAAHSQHRHYKETGETEAYVAALENLSDLRLETEGDHIANIALLTWAENRTWDRSVLDASSESAE